MDLKQMQYFLCLAQERNVTRAARRLNIVQPALSMQIAKLEAGLGKQLFFRTAQGMSLTSAGEEFERLVAPIVKDIDRAREEMARLDGKVAGRVSIGMINSAAQSILPVSTLRIAKAYPDIELSICEGYSETMLEWVLAGQLDLAIVNARQRGSTPAMQPILDEEMMLAHAASSEWTLPKQVTFSAIGKLDLVIPSRRHGLRRGQRGAERPRQRPLGGAGRTERLPGGRAQEEPDAHGRLPLRRRGRRLPGLGDRSPARRGARRPRGGTGRRYRPGGGRAVPQGGRRRTAGQRR